MEAIEELATENRMSHMHVPFKIYIEPEPFSIENNILTPTYKLKRHAAKEKYLQVIADLYAW